MMAWWRPRSTSRPADGSGLTARLLGDGLVPVASALGQHREPARRLAYDEVQVILARDLPVIPLWHEHNVAVMNVDVRAFRIDPSATLWGLATAWKAR